MTVPAGLIWKEGAFWSADGVGPLGVDATGAARGLWDAAGLRAGEMTQYNRTAGGAICGYGTPITTLATFNGVAASSKLLYGFWVVTGTATGTISAYDDVTAVAANLILNAASIATNNTFIPVGVPGMGFILQRGLTIVTAVASSGIILPIYQL